MNVSQFWRLALFRSKDSDILHSIMPIAERTIKGLFAKSQNVCAMPECGATLVIGDTVLGEICHIRARRKGGARYDSTFSEEQKNAAANLILLCPTCHTLVDKDKRGVFPPAWLEGIKAQHERGGGIELTPNEARQALALLAKHQAKSKRSITRANVSGGAQSRADRGGVAVSIGGNNQGDIHVRTGSSKAPRGDAPNSIGANANLSGYVDYLCELYVKYMSPIERDVDALWGRLGKQIKAKFRLAKRTRNDLPADRFPKLVEFLHDKLAVTPVGRGHVSRGNKLCSSFQEWRNTTR